MNKTLKAKELLKDYNERKGTSIAMRSEIKDLIIEAIDCDENAVENGQLLDYIVNCGKVFTRALKDYIKNYTYESTRDESAVEPKESTLDDFKNEIIKLKYELKQAQEHSQIGLLEKTLAQVVIQTQGESIKNEIMGDFKKQATDFILENYGPITRKINVEINETPVDFGDEVLHEQFETVLKFVQSDEPVFLTGPAGTGKNVLCKQVAKALDLDFYFTNAVTQEYKITGFTDANGVYHETQFEKAFKYGGLFMLDEMDASIPEVLTILNASIANRYFDFPSGKDENGNEIGGFCEAHPDFRIIAAGNTFGLGADYEYVGRNQLDMATLDRFALVEIDYDKNIELNVAEGDSELVDFVEELRKVASDNGIRMVISYRAIGRIAKMQKLLSMKDTLKTCLLKNLRKDDIQVLMSNITTDNKYFRTIRNEILN